MLTRLKVNKFRHVKPGTELTFREGFNVLLGRNGTGKTTLLDLISRVVRSDFSSLRDEEFDLDYDLTHLLGRVHIEIRNTPVFEGNGDGDVARRPRAPSAVRPLDAFFMATLLYGSQDRPTRMLMEATRSTFKMKDESNPWIDVAAIDLFGGDIFAEISSRLTFTKEITSADPDFLFLELSMDAAWAHRFDESLGTYDAITGSASSRESNDLAQKVSLSRCFHLTSGSHFYPDAISSATLPWSNDVSEPAPGQASAGVSLKTHPLVDFPPIVGFAAMTMSLFVESSARRDDGVWWNFGRAEFQFSERGGSTFSHHALSYGQKRLLAFLYYRSINRRYVIADELVNGMHHDWIRTCVDLCSEPGTQSFLTSQNPLLLDYIPLASAEDARQTFIQCRTEVTNGRARFAWSNLSEEDARELFADHQVGIQHLGELLRVRGLW